MQRNFGSISSLVVGQDFERPKHLLCTKRSHDQLAHCQLLQTPWSGIHEAPQIRHIVGIVHVARIQSRYTSGTMAKSHGD